MEHYFTVAITSLSAAIVWLFKDNYFQNKKIGEIQKQHLDCTRELAILKLKLEWLQSETKYISKPCFITAVLPSQEIIDASPETEHLIGYNKDELIGKTIDFLVSDEFKELHKTKSEEAIKRGSMSPGIISVAAFANHKDGNKVPVIVSLTEQSKEPWIVTAQINYRRIK